MAINHTDSSISSLATKIGFWAASTAALTFILYTICFTAILLSSPLFTWTNLTDYVTYIEMYGGPFRPLAQFTMLLFGLSFVVLLNSIHACTPAAKKILTQISLSFGLLFAVTIGIHYFAQLSAVQLNMLAGEIEGLEHFLQANPHFDPIGHQYVRVDDLPGLGLAVCGPSVFWRQIGAPDSPRLPAKWMVLPRWRDRLHLGNRLVDIRDDDIGDGRCRSDSYRGVGDLVSKAGKRLGRSHRGSVDPLGARMGTPTRRQHLLDKPLC